MANENSSMAGYVVIVSSQYLGALYAEHHAETEEGRQAVIDKMAEGLGTVFSQQPPEDGQYRCQLPGLGYIGESYNVCRIPGGDPEKGILRLDDGRTLATFTINR